MLKCFTIYIMFISVECALAKLGGLTLLYIYHSENFTSLIRKRKIHHVFAAKFDASRHVSQSLATINKYVRAHVHACIEAYFYMPTNFTICNYTPQHISLIFLFQYYDVLAWWYNTISSVLILNMFLAFKHSSETKLNFLYSSYELIDPRNVEATRKEIEECTDRPVACYYAEYSKFRTIDGSCNNLKHPTWGKADICLKRILPFDYADSKFCFLYQVYKDVFRFYWETLSKWRE